MVILSRRSALKAGVALAGAGAALWGAAHLAKSDGPLADSYAAQSIGERFATRFPEAATWGARFPADPGQWAGHLETLMADDLATDRLVEVDGWWLTETEVRLCVLVYAGQ